MKKWVVEYVSIIELPRLYKLPLPENQKNSRLREAGYLTHALSVWPEIDFTGSGTDTRKKLDEMIRLTGNAWLISIGGVCTANLPIGIRSSASIWVAIRGDIQLEQFELKRV